MNEYRDLAFQNAEEKGFHAVKMTDLEALTHKQLCHLFIELCEAEGQYSCDAIRETAVELADVAIVALDLAGIHKIDVGPATIIMTRADATDTVWNSLGTLLVHIQRLADCCRKEGKLSPNALCCVIGRALATIGLLGHDPIEVLTRKMIVNAGRPALYGIGEANGKPNQVD